MGDLWFVKVVSLMSGESPIWNPSTFTMSDQTLIDRGTYCLLVVATLLDIITPELIHNVDKFIAACQTYEGGFACSSFPFADGGRAAQAEAHGVYTSCALNSYFLLSTMIPPKTTTSLGNFPATIDVDAALRWSVMQQGEAIEAGGFRGRSNKLVDGCYSWWVGGGVPVVEALAARAKGDEDEEGKLLSECRTIKLMCSQTIPFQPWSVFQILWEI
jgi:protein farnesyltransferase subunit beta